MRHQKKSTLPVEYGRQKKTYGNRSSKMNSRTLEVTVAHEHIRQNIEDFLRRSGIVTESEDVIKVDLSNFLILDESIPSEKNGVLKFTINKHKD